MIQAHSLMVGNIVDIINRSHKIHLPMGLKMRVIEIKLFHVVLVPFGRPWATIPDSEHVTVDINDISPIPLSPDLLVKAGFERLTPTICLYTLDNCMLKVLFHLHDPYVEIYLEEYEGDIEIPCKHLHRLQNLVLSLTGQPLNISL